eukprot:m.289819 g.289819  ORF g.289819 m.289819 type:complete len:60 (+) comp15810_c0_seq19:1069-1248(+)
MVHTVCFLAGISTTTKDAEFTKRLVPFLLFEKKCHRSWLNQLCLRRVDRYAIMCSLFVR